MVSEYDAEGNYTYPEGFDPETNEWKEGFDTQREAWEQEYALAQTRWEAHKKQVASAAEIEQNVSAVAPSSSSNSFTSEAAGAGTLADDESLAALREKLAGN